MRISTFQGWWQDRHGDHGGHNWIWTQPYVIKAKVYDRFLFCTQDTTEGVSDLGSIAVL